MSFQVHVHAVRPVSVNNVVGIEKFGAMQSRYTGEDSWQLQRFLMSFLKRLDVLIAIRLNEGWRYNENRGRLSISADLAAIGMLNNSTQARANVIGILVETDFQIVRP